ncbi:MAG: ComEC/Rec2 family competence protein [Candidatus Moranbacteria bacterium]|nr:ComEC/Rec2 family competence protein [Candidatus Moranbacteria bacterium]
MRYRKIIYLGVIILLIIVCILNAVNFISSRKSLSVNFLDVGQGDAILISQGDRQILIDGGPSGTKLMEKLGKYIPFWDRKIEIIIETHPDQDHIAGLVDALQNYQIGEVIQSRAENDTEVYKKLKDIIAAKNIPALNAEAGMEIKLADNIPLKIISAETGTPKDTNPASVVAKLTYGQNSFLFTGDLPSENEKNLADIQADILKVSHHGSKYATSTEFLNAVKPKDAVISVGKNNKYGHPAPEILERLSQAKINIWRTDEMGDIEYKCQNPEIDCILIAD